LICELVKKKDFGIEKKSFHTGRKKELVQ